MLNLQNYLLQFVRDPDEFRYRDYMNNALIQIETLSDLLSLANKSDLEMEDTTSSIALMIQEISSDLKEITKVWADTKIFNELEEEKGLILMAEADDGTLYGERAATQRYPVNCNWFLHDRLLAKKLTDDEAKQWYEDNQLESVSPFHREYAA